MKHRNQEPADEQFTIRRQAEPSSENPVQAGSDSDPRIAYAQEASSGKASQLGRQLKDGASRQSARIRDRLDNRTLPDADPGANGVPPYERQPSETESEGIRSVRMMPATDETQRLPKIGSAMVAAIPSADAALAIDASNGDAIGFADGADADAAAHETSLTDVNETAAATTDTGVAEAGGEAGPMSGTYIDLTQPQPTAGALSGGMPATDSTCPLTGIREAFGQTVRAYRRRRAADRSIRRNSRERVYRLKGYTTVAKVNRKFASERRQRLLRRVLTMIIILLTLILLFQLYNPVRDLSEWYRILGIENKDGKSTQSTDPFQSGSVTVTPAVTSATTAPTTTATTKPTATTRTTTRATTRR